MKNIRGKMVVAAGVAVALTGVVIARAQFVSLDGSAMHVASQHVDSAQKVTKSFDHVPAKDVVEWARSRNLPLTIADKDIPSREVTLELVDVEAIDVGPLLADAMGLSAKKDGDKYVLTQDGPDIEINVDDVPQIAELAVEPSLAELPAIIDGTVLPSTAMVGEIPQVFEKIKKEMGLKDLKDIENADEKTKARFKELVEKHMSEWAKNFEAKFNSKEFQLKMEKFGKDFEKKFNSPEYKAKMEAFAKQFDSPEFKAKMEKFGKDFEKKFDSPEWQEKMKALGEKWNSPEHKAEMEKWAKEMKAHAGEMKLNAEQMKELHEHLQKQLHGELGNMKLNDEQMKELHDHLQKLHGELGDAKTARAFALDAKAMADMERFHALGMQQGGGQVVIVGPDGKKQTIEAQGGPIVITIGKDGKYKVTSAGKGERAVVVKSSGDGKITVVGPDGKAKALELNAAGKGGSVVTLGKSGTYTVTGADGKKQTITLKGGDKGFALAGPEAKAWAEHSAKFAVTSEKIKKLMDSLTDKQQELMKKQGYLTPTDLTPTQRELLGDMGKGQFEFAFSVDGKSIRIKNKEPKAAGSVGV